MINMKGREDVFLVFVSGKPGRETDYARWFARRHMSDMRGLTGVRSAHPFYLTGIEKQAPAQLCGIYEFADGPAVLKVIAASKGTEMLPHSENQGPMIWRLLSTVEEGDEVAIPDGTALIIVLLGLPRENINEDSLRAYSAQFREAGATYVRSMRLHSMQPTHGSEYGAALILALEPALLTLTHDLIAKALPGIPWLILVAEPIPQLDGETFFPSSLEHIDVIRHFPNDRSVIDMP
jgi:hypothetical protein